MEAILRVARATGNLKLISQMYKEGLGLSELASFQNHAGFDGVILGHNSSAYHFEFTQEAGAQTFSLPSAEDLIVFYLPNKTEWEKAKKQMLIAGFLEVPSHNPYWDVNGSTFKDPEGYRVVLSNRNWP